MTTLTSPAPLAPPVSISAVGKEPRAPRYSPRHVPLATVEATEHRQRRLRGPAITLACPACGKVYGAGAVVTSSVEWVENYRLAHYTGYMVTRRLYCDHENIIIKWDQACDGNGNLGQEIGTYSLVRDKAKIVRFLRDHPEAAGVAQ